MHACMIVIGRRLVGVDVHEATSLDAKEVDSMISLRRVHEKERARARHLTAHACSSLVAAMFHVRDMKMWGGACKSENATSMHELGLTRMILLAYLRNGGFHPQLSPCTHQGDHE
jgi:hypothetical protein